MFFQFTISSNRWSRGPVANKRPPSSGAYIAGEQLTAEIECCLLTLVLRVEVRGRMITKVHTNDDAEECADHRHRQPYWFSLLAMFRFGPPICFINSSTAVSS